MKKFNVSFRKNKQYVTVYLHSVSPETFQRMGGGRWGYYLPAENRNNFRGFFGEIHLVENRLRMDLISHELFHFVSDFIYSRGRGLSPYNEEYYASIMDEVTRNLIKALRKKAGHDIIIRKRKR
jgi:hypothetical protein